MADVTDEVFAHLLELPQTADVMSDNQALVAAERRNIQRQAHVFGNR